MGRIQSQESMENEGRIFHKWFAADPGTLTDNELRAVLEMCYSKIEEDGVAVANVHDLEAQKRYGINTRMGDMIVRTLLDEGTRYQDAMAALALEVGLKPELIEKILPAHGGKNPIYGFVDGKEVRRTTWHSKCKKEVCKLWDFAAEYFDMSKIDFSMHLALAVGYPSTSIRTMLDDYPGMPVRRAAIKQFEAVHGRSPDEPKPRDSHPHQSRQSTASF